MVSSAPAGEASFCPRRCLLGRQRCSRASAPPAAHEPAPASCRAPPPSEACPPSSGDSPRGAGPCTRQRRHNRGAGALVLDVHATGSCPRAARVVSFLRHGQHRLVRQNPGGRRDATGQPSMLEELVRHLALRMSKPPAAASDTHDSQISSPTAAPSAHLPGVRTPKSAKHRVRDSWSIVRASMHSFSAGSDKEP
jgi:hypothetical protein